MFALYKKEFTYFVNNPVGYIVIVLFAVFANFLYLKDIFVVGSASMRPFFGAMPWLLMVFIPAIAMRSFAEEKRTNTIETLFSLPLTEREIVLAKFFALLTVVGIALLLTVGLPVSLFIMTRFSLSEVIISYLGVLATAGFFIALSLFCSVKTKNQVVSFLISTLILFILIMFSSDFLATVFPKEVLDMVSYFGPVYQLGSFLKGVVDVRAVFYFLSFISFFLTLTTIELTKKQ